MSKKRVNGASPIKRKTRRTQTEMETLKSEIYTLVSEMKPMTVRQVFYQLSTRGLIEKTEGEYNSTVCRLLTQMRLGGDLPFNWIADNTRWMRKPDSHENLREMLDITASAYRRAIWCNQPDYVEIWLEKEALSGVVVPVTAQWDVPLMVTRGYPSISYLHGAAQSIEYGDKPAFIYYFGDLDPSGVDIARNVEQRLNEFAPTADITFQRVAVTPEQASELNLPSRPTKSTDSRSASFQGDSIELDAIVPDTLRQMVADCIERHVDEDALSVTQEAERSERLLLDNWEDIVNSLEENQALGEWWQQT